MDGMGWFTSKISYCMLLIAALFTRKTGRVSSLPPSLLPSLPPWFLGWFLAQANNSAVMSTSPVPTLTASPAIVPLTARSLCVCVCARACGCTGKWQTHYANHGILMRVRTHTGSSSATAPAKRFVVATPMKRKIEVSWSQMAVAGPRAVGTSVWVGVIGCTSECAGVCARGCTCAHMRAGASAQGCMCDDMWCMPARAREKLYRPMTHVSMRDSRGAEIHIPSVGNENARIFATVIESLPASTSTSTSTSASAATSTSASRDSVSASSVAAAAHVNRRMLMLLRRWTE